MPRSIVEDQEEINYINLHAFGDASSQGLSAAVYAVMHQPSDISQGLVAAKSRIGKNGLTILRLKLVAGNTATNSTQCERGSTRGKPPDGVRCTAFNDASIQRSFKNFSYDSTYLQKDKDRFHEYMKLVMHVHTHTLHRGVSLTMT